MLVPLIALIVSSSLRPGVQVPFTLHILVRNLYGKSPVPGIQLGVDEPGINAAEVTGDDGKTSFDIPSRRRSAEYFHLKLLGAKPNWQIVSPADGEFQASRDVHTIVVEVVVKNSQTAINDPTFVRALQHRVIATRRLGSTEEGNRRALADTAAFFGYQPLAVDHAIRALPTEGATRLVKAEKLLYEQRYDDLFRLLLKTPNTVEEASVLAQAYFAEGKYKQAVKYATLAHSRRPANTSYESILGSAYQGDNQFELAKPLLTDVLAADRRYEGSNTASVAIDCTNLGALYSTLEDYDSAEPLLREAVDSSTKVCGKSDPFTALCMCNLAWLLMQTNRLPEAKSLYDNAYAIGRKVFPAASPDMALLNADMGGFLVKIGKYSEGSKYLRQALGVQKRGSKPSSLSVAITMVNLSQADVSLDNFAEAEAMLTAAASYCYASLGPDAKNTVTAESNLGALYRNEGKFDMAEQTYKNLLKGEGKMLMTNRIRVNSNLGVLYNDECRYEEALLLAQRALDQLQAVYHDAENLPGAVIQTNVGMAHLGLGHFPEAESFISVALATRLKMLKKDDINIALSYSAMGYLLIKKGKFADAKEYLEKCLSIQVPAVGLQSSQVAVTHLHMGEMDQGAGRFLDAEKSLRTA